MDSRKAHPLETEDMTVLASLEGSRIVDFVPTRDGLVIAEMCDGYFRRLLTRTQFAQMIAELQALLEKME